MLALAPKAPFIGYGGQFEGYEHQWKTANTQNWPYLEVNPDVTDGAGSILPLPQRAAPPLAQTGLIQAKMGASDDIKSTTGYYDSSLGATSNERSGRAILARERQGDTGSYHYVDNLARAIRYVTRQLVDLIPKIYDTQRIARIIGIDGETSTVRIDPMQQEPVRKLVDQAGVVIEKIYNPSVGKYDVAVTTGPSYMTKRQEAMEARVALFEKRIRAQWPTYAKNMTDDNILAIQWFMPETVNASKPDMIEGGYVEGAHLASQLGRFRPIPELAGYKTILPNLYNCSANVHAGSGIGRGSSYNCFQQIAADLGIDPQAEIRKPDAD